MNHVPLHNRFQVLSVLEEGRDDSNETEQPIYVFDETSDGMSIRDEVLVECQCEAHAALASGSD